MSGLTFSNIVPRSYLATPTKFRSDNDLSMILDNLCEATAMTRLDRSGMELTEYAAKVMDEYFNSPAGKNDMFTLQDLSHKVSQHFSGAFSVLTNTIAPEVEMLTSRIDQVTTQLMDRKLGFTDQDGKYTDKAPRFKQLDVRQLYAAYHEDASKCAVNLCKKYNYFIDTLNDNNIVGLLDRIDPVNRIDIDQTTLQAILEDIVIAVTADKNGEVTIDTNVPDAVVVEGDGVTVENTNSPDEKAESSPESDNGNVNVNITTDNDDANITISVDGDNLTTENDTLIALEELETSLAQFEQNLNYGTEGLNTDAIFKTLTKLQLLVRKNFTGSEKVLKLILGQVERLQKQASSSDFVTKSQQAAEKYTVTGDDNGYVNFILNLDGLKHIDSLFPKYDIFTNDCLTFLFKILDVYTHMDKDDPAQFIASVGSAENIERLFNEMQAIYTRVNEYPPEMLGLVVNPSKGGITPFSEEKIEQLMRPYVVSAGQSLEIDHTYIKTALPLIHKFLASQISLNKVTTAKLEKVDKEILNIGDVSRRAAKRFAEFGKPKEIGRGLAAFMYMYKGMIRLISTSDRMTMKLWVVLVKREVKEVAKAIQYYTGKSLAKEEYLPAEQAMLMTMVKACFSPAAFDQLRKTIFATKGSVRDTHLLNSLFFVSHSIPKLMERCAASHLNPTTMMMVRKNLSRLHELQMGTLIFLDVSSSRFADKILIGRTLLNKNQILRAQGDGVDIYPILRDYLRVYHNDDHDDIYHAQMQNQAILNGISYDQVMVTRYDVEQKLIKARESTKDNYQHLLNASRQAAFKEVMFKYARDVAERGSPEELKVNKNDKAAFISRNTLKINNLHTQMIQNKNASNVEDLIYSFYLSNWYGGTLVEDLYYHVGEYLRQSANRETLSDSAIAMVKSEAIATLSTKYLFTQFVNE